MYSQEFINKIFELFSISNIIKILPMSIPLIIAAVLLVLFIWFVCNIK